MQQPSSDPRTPFVIGIIALGIVLLGGIVWAVVSAPPAGTGQGPQPDPNLSFRDEHDPTLGPSDAKVTVRIFGDLECPACKAAEPGITHIRRNYADTVRIVWDDFPLPPTIHPKARIAANAARCAEEQGKFWEMHDELYNAQDAWTKSGNPEEDFVALARKIGLNEDGFRSCYDGRRHDGKIANDMQEGSANGVNSTPTFFVNNMKYIGVMSPTEWDNVLKPLLEGPAMSPAAPQSSEDGEPQS